eukprot:COSAG01_NODE_10989_length_2031_cov_171.756808_3_plen_154_part_00
MCHGSSRVMLVNSTDVRAIVHDPPSPIPPDAAVSAFRIAGWLVVVCPLRNPRPRAAHETSGRGPNQGPHSAAPVRWRAAADSRREFLVGIGVRAPPPEQLDSHPPGQLSPAPTSPSLAPAAGVALAGPTAPRGDAGTATTSAKLGCRTQATAL